MCYYSITESDLNQIAKSKLKVCISDQEVVHRLKLQLSHDGYTSLRWIESPKILQVELKGWDKDDPQQPNPFSIVAKVRNKTGFFEKHEQLRIEDVLWEINKYILKDINRDGNLVTIVDGVGKLQNAQTSFLGSIVNNLPINCGLIFLTNESHLKRYKTEDRPGYVNFTEIFDSMVNDLNSLNAMKLSYSSDEKNRLNDFNKAQLKGRAYIKSVKSAFDQINKMAPVLECQLSTQTEMFSKLENEKNRNFFRTRSILLSASLLLKNGFRPIVLWAAYDKLKHNGSEVDSNLNFKNYDEFVENLDALMQHS